MGRCPLELAQGLSRVASILHVIERSAPFGVTCLPAPQLAPPCCKAPRVAMACCKARLASMGRVRSMRASSTAPGVARPGAFPRYAALPKRAPRPRPPAQPRHPRTLAYPSAGKRASRACYPHQRLLQIILAYCPTTAGSAQFCLLCCQPEPIPGTLAARMSQLTSWDPCRLPV